MDHFQHSPQVAIADLLQYVGQEICLNGTVETVRDQKRMQFLILRVGDRAVQVAHEKAGSSELSEAVTSLTTGSAVGISGEVRKAPQVKLGGVEISMSEMSIYSLAEAPLPILEDSSPDKQMDWRQLSLRRPEMRLAIRTQTVLEQAMRRWWETHDFLEIHSPKLMGTFSESGAEVFRLDYFGGSAFLAQSPQFYKQMAMAGGLDRVFEIGPAFRAEPSFTTRHETEFTSIDMEIAWTASHRDLLALEEQWLAASIGHVDEVLGPQIADVFGVNLVPPRPPFPRVTMAEAQEIVRNTGYAPHRTDDLDPEAERRLSAFVLERFGHEFVFVTDYPATARPFYHARHPDRPELTQSFDLLWNGVEITTGAQREHRYDHLRRQAVERGYALGPLESYLNFFRYGCPPHGGMGVGLARLLMVMLGRQSVREVILLSRTPKRLSP
ncbi:aspartate--tRNA(Asn) ligase [Phenylobacterium sp.]|uniref:aspartate--tRNA(Asn) ligase n=1 Tax=Phenylobacterium sp. TaxID=1871053 RepID=UPI0035B1491E